MPITSITIENFKGVADRVTVPLRPITLLFGANSAGKSTILQALLYLRELLERGNPNADVLAGCGHAVNLGGFQKIVHGHDLDRKVRIGVTTTVDDDGLPEFAIARADDGDESNYEPGADTYPHSVKTAGIIVEVEHHPIQGPWISTYTVEINGAVQGSIACQPGEVAKIVIQPESRFCKLLLRLMGLVVFEPEDLDDLDDDERSFLEEEDAASTRPVDPEREGIIKEFAETLAGRIAEVEKARGELEALGTKLLQSGEVFEYVDGVIPHLEKGITSLGFPDVLETTDLAPPKFQMHRILSQVFAGTGQLVLNELKRIRYIGPIREIPSRNFESERSADLGRWANGTAAWDVLHKSTSKPDWLNLKTWDKLGLGYSLDFSKVLVIPSSGKLGVALERFRMGEADALKAIKSLPKREVAGYEEQHRFRLLAANSGLPVAPRDVGVGVSQALPVAIGAMQPGYSILAVEQPELHVHPAVQCRLADLLVAQVLPAKERILLLETHSEHLILRLLRRIREQHEGKLPDGAPPLQPDDVCVLYADNVEGKMTLTELPVTEEGDFAREWPNGFFEERAEELF